MPFGVRLSAKEYFNAFYKHNHVKFVIASLFTVLDVPAALVGSWILGQIIDVISTGDLGRLKQVFWLSVVFVMASLAVSLIMYRVKANFICRALTNYKIFAFQRLSRRGARAFSRENTGSYLSLLTNDIISIEENYLKGIFLLVYNSILFVATFGMMFWYSPKLTLVVVGLSTLPLASSVLMGNELVKREQSVSDENEKFVTQLKDLLVGFSIIKSFRAEDEANRLFGVVGQRVEESKRRRYWWECLIGAVSGNLCASVLQFGVFLVGAWLAIEGQITAGTVLIFVNLCNYVIQPVNVVPQCLASRKAAMGLVAKLAAATEEKYEPVGKAIEPVLMNSIELKHVSFSYSEGAPALHDISIVLDAGGSYAIVGASGSGKSTLLNLLMGSFDSYEGDVCFDGHELRDIEPASLYDLISMIDQHTFIFDDTLLANVTMFRDFPEADVAEAIERAGLSSLMAEKGMGYQCGENGAALSGGERQRISIARALLRNTPILLLDEATASLDNQTAFETADKILSIENLTKLVVTHRLDPSLLKRCDKIVTMHGGRIVEIGTFDELMDVRGYFYSLYKIAH